MRQYKVNRTNNVKLPSKETIAKHKNFTRLWHEYDNVVKRPKKPLYKDKKMFFILLFIALMAMILSQVAAEDKKKEQDDKKKNQPTSMQD